MATVHVLKEALDSALAAPHPILLDLGETRYIDTTAIQALLRARERHHTALAVAALAPALKRVFDILQVGRAIPLYKTLTTALATLCPPSVPSGAPRP